MCGGGGKGGRVRGVSAVHCGARPRSPRPAVGFKDRRDLNRGQWETGNLGDLGGSPAGGRWPISGVDREGKIKTRLGEVPREDGRSG